MKFLFTRVFSLLCALGFLAEAQGSEAVAEFGQKLTPHDCDIRFKVPRRVFELLPKEMNIYAVDAPMPFTKTALEWVIDNAAVDAQEKEAWKRQVDKDPALLEHGRTALLHDKQSQLTVDPNSGLILFRGAVPENMVQVAQQMPGETRSNILAFSVFKEKLKELVQQLGGDDSEIERKPNGDYFMQVADDNGFPHHGKTPLLFQRSVMFFRQINGYPLISTTFHQIKLTRLASGAWREIFVYWPKLKPAQVIAVSWHSNEDLKNAFAASQMFWAESNQIKPKEAGKITVTDIRLGYFQAKGSPQLSPALLLDADLKNANGEDYAVIFLPLL